MCLFEREKQRGAGGTRGLFEEDQEIDPDRFPLLSFGFSSLSQLDFVQFGEKEPGMKPS